MTHNRTTRSNSLNADSAVPVTMNDIQQLKNDILTSITQQFSSLTNCIQALDLRIGNLEKSLNNFRSIQNKQQTEINEIKHALVNLDLSKAEFLDEVEDRERRRNNIVLFGLPELESGNVEARKEHDKNSLESVLEAIDCEGVKIDSVFRLGKVVEGKARPVKAILCSREGKMEILRKSRSLRNTDQFKRVFISIDKTKFQQSEWNKLRNEQVARKEAGEDVIIYGGRVVLRNSIQNFRK